MTKVWVYGYECSSEEVDLNDAEKTFNKILEADQEETCCLRDASFSGKLNALTVKYYGCGSFTVKDGFGNSCDITTSEYTDAYYDDEYEAVDALFDKLSDKLIFDRQTVESGVDLASIEDSISNYFN